MEFFGLPPLFVESKKNLRIMPGGDPGGPTAGQPLIILCLSRWITGAINTPFSTTAFDYVPQCSTLRKVKTWPTIKSIHCTSSWYINVITEVEIKISYSSLSRSIMDYCVYSAYTQHLIVCHSLCLEIYNFKGLGLGLVETETKTFASRPSQDQDLGVARPRPRSWLSRPRPWLSRPRPRPWLSRPRPRPWLARPRPRPWKNELECTRDQDLGLEDNKTELTYLLF